MAERRTAPKRGGRRRAGGLRKHQQVEHVIVEDAFNLIDNSDKVGEGVYVSATTGNNKRYYGVLLDQPALKEASAMWFQDQADSLELNKRMKVLTRQHQTAAAEENEANDGPAPKKQRTAAKTTVGSDRAVQKFKFIWNQETPKVDRFGKPGVEDPGYRVLVATFSSINEAAGGDPEKARSISKACEDGGDFLDEGELYYYQYEVLPAALSAERGKNAEFELRTSMGFHSFLLNTPLPPWFPLSNLQLGQHKVLSMLNMKRDTSGKVTWETKPEATSGADTANAVLKGGTRLTMQPREKMEYRIGVIGGGIAGLACCQELTKLLADDGIDARVTLLEARSRLGGRLCTDNTLTLEDNSSFPVELGASWIHGINDNPLAALAKSANIDFVTASEEVQMLGKDLERMDAKTDKRMIKLFDDLLDYAADDCWSAQEMTAGAKINGNDLQAAVRWYSEALLTEEGKSDTVNEGADKKATREFLPKKIDPTENRRSSDRSIDFGIGKAVSKYKFREFSKLNVKEHRMLLWHTKNIEYALGANVSDLSMKFWDSDERHAFEGDHVLLKQGYSSVIDHMLESLKGAGDRFECLLDFPAGKVEYARRSTSKAYDRDKLGRSRKLVELSDTCSVTSQDGNRTMYFDFLVCAVPLGVLKDSLLAAPTADKQPASQRLAFHPSLPFSKTDAISNVGFGLLDKIFLHFSEAFWRLPDLFREDDQCLFGNVSGINPQHYMFFDIGKCLHPGGKAPPVLMLLISGTEAAISEMKADKELVGEVMTTLRAIFSKSTVPDPVSFRVTRWGSDPYARGSYTFLPPGTTDQDFQLLQTPVNGNGDSLLLDSSETMRLFFAGEHTTALHPSMAHGAMLSGMRAAKELVSTLQCKQREEKDVDRVIPVALFRSASPHTPLRCSLCHKVGGQVREGSLLAFKRGTRQVLVHNNCAEYSPEVEVLDSKWKNVIKAVNRGKNLNCSLCGQNGPTIGCTADNCYRVFHYSCSEDTGWRFERDGKVFYCDLHREGRSGVTHGACDRVSLKYYTKKNPTAPLPPRCTLCSSHDESAADGKLLAFQQDKKMMIIREGCLKYTNVVNVVEVEQSRIGKEYSNVFSILDKAMVCSKCGKPGATIRCTNPKCDNTQRFYHFNCAKEQSPDWNYKKRPKAFYCCDRPTATGGPSASASAPSSAPRTVSIAADAAEGAESTATTTAATDGITTQPAPSTVGPTAGVEAVAEGGSAAVEITTTETTTAPALASAATGGVDHGNLLNHNLLSQFGAEMQGQKTDIPSNQDMGGTTIPTTVDGANDDSDDDSSSTSLQESDSDHSLPGEAGMGIEVMDVPLTTPASVATILVRLERKSKTEHWNLRLNVAKVNDTRILSIAEAPVSFDDLFSLKRGDTVVSVNSRKIGSPRFQCLRDVLHVMRDETDLMLEVIRGSPTGR